MKPSFRMKFTLSIITSLLSFLLVGCSQEEHQSQNNDKESLVSLSVSAYNLNLSPETEITSLRMVIFNATDNSPVLNKQYNPNEVYNSTSDKYSLNTKIKNVSKARIFVIANERQEWQLNNGLTYDQLQQLEVNYFDQAAELSNVTSPFLMIAGGNEEITIQPDNDTNVELTLVRNVVKVTLKLKQKLPTPWGTAPLTIKKAWIEKLPKKGFFASNTAYTPTEGYTTTNTTDLEAIGFNLSENYSTLKNDQIFYIPENILTDKTHYSRLIITASDGNTDIIYEVPLGKRADKLYDKNAPASIDDLTADDLSIERSSHFIIDATIEQTHLSAALKVKDWTLKEVDGDISDLLLNISSLVENATVVSKAIDGVDVLVTDPEKIVFNIWTNYRKDELILHDKVSTATNSDIPMSDLFSLTSTITEQTEGYMPNITTTTMKLEFQFKDVQDARTRGDDFTMKVSVKNISRTFRIHLVTPTPIP